MKWYTEIQAKCPNTGVLKTYSGPYIEAPSFEAAKKYCEDNNLGYCKVIGKLKAVGQIKHDDLFNQN